LISIKAATPPASHDSLQPAGDRGPPLECNQNDRHKTTLESPRDDPAVLVWTAAVHGPRDLSRCAAHAQLLKTATGATLYTLDDLQVGRQVWQTTGGQELGSVWGHGGYVAPDWSADWLHREATGLLELWAKRDFGKAFAELDHSEQGALKARLQDEMRANTYDKATGVVTVSETAPRSSSRWPSTTRGSSARTPSSIRCARSTRSARTRCRIRRDGRP
jgi:hypothetical protein